LQQQVAIDVFGRDHADQLPVIHDHHGVRACAVDDLFTRGRQLFLRRHQCDIGIHNRHHRCVGSLGVHCRDKLRPRHDADELSLVEHGKIVLSCLIDQLDPARHRVRGRKHRDPPAHHILHVQVTQHASHPHDAFLAFGAQKDKRPDQDEPE